MHFGDVSFAGIHFDVQQNNEILQALLIERIAMKILLSAYPCLWYHGNLKEAQARFAKRLRTFRSGMPQDNGNAVPFFVLRLSNDEAKALFTVPSDVAEVLISHPILCRGASFDLKIDVVSRERSSSVRDSDTTFLSTHFSSPDPEETARAIAERIAIRQANPSPNVNFFGWRTEMLQNAGGFRQGSCTYTSSG